MGETPFPDNLASVFDACPDAMIVSDRGGRIVLANGLAATLFGYPLEVLRGLAVEALVPDSVRIRHAGYRQAYQRAPRTRPMGSETELVARRADGTEVMVEIGLSPLVNDGQTYVVAAIRAIADFPRVKDALLRARYSEQLARLGRIAADSRNPMRLIEQVPALACEALGAEVARVLLLEPDGRHLRIEAGVGDVAGLAVGDRIEVRPDSIEYRVMTSGESLQVDDLARERRLDGHRADGHRVLVDAGLGSALAVPLFDRGRTLGALMIGARGPGRFRRRELQFVEALSSTLTTLLQRAESDDALNHALRLRGIGQLTGGIAHDFNNLLTIIRGNLQLLEEYPAIADSAELRPLVDAGLRASDRGANLTSKLLAFARRQVLRPARVEVGPMLASLTDLLGRTFDQRIEISTRIDGSALAIRVDRGQIESALLNIAINARDAMPRGGPLAFRAWYCETLPPTARREIEPGRGAASLLTAGRSASAATPASAASPSEPRSAGFVAISVSDAGAGMVDEVRERVFEPFFTTKAEGRGTGLGLAVVYGFVTQSNGGIEIDSTPGRGTTLTLYLPADPGPVAAPSSDEAVTPVALPAGLRILLVEDEADVRRVTSRMLRGLGCRVTAVASGERALERLASRRSIDLVLTDVALGADIRGTRVAAEARRHHPGIAVVLMSGFSAALLDEEPAVPADALLAKPFDRAALARALAVALAAAVAVAPGAVG